MNPILCRQMAADYCCTEEEVLDDQNHFTRHCFLEERRRFEEKTECYLKAAVVNGKLLFTGNPDIVEWCAQTYRDSGSAWFFEAKNLRRLNNRLHESGHQIEMVHPFFTAGTPGPDPDVRGYEIRWYEEDEIEQFRGDSRFDKAYSFYDDTPDVIGVAALRDGVILGMAGASCDSPLLWQIGINVEPCARKEGIGKMLVILLKNEILKRGRLPYYGTSMSHIASLRVAVGSGFVPAWSELVTSAIPGSGSVI